MGTMSERTPDALLAYLRRQLHRAFIALDEHCKAGRLPTEWEPADTLRTSHVAALEAQVARELREKVAALEAEVARLHEGTDSIEKECRSSLMKAVEVMVDLQSRIRELNEQLNAAHAEIEGLRKTPGLSHEEMQRHLEENSP